MSRIGKQPIEIPANVEVNINKGEVTVKGPKGELVQDVNPKIKIEKEENRLVFTPQDKTRKTYAMWGLYRSLLANMVEGVTHGVSKNLEVYGVGYRAAVQGNNLVLNLGLSHPVEIEPPEGIEFSVEGNVITVSGIDKQKVGEMAAKIKAKRKPDSYKGKGIRYQGEEIRLKQGKKGGE
jgi:large subunit ribosomal protein L6